MRRAPIVITATVLGSAGVLLFKPLPVSTPQADSSGSAAASSDNTSSTTSGDTGSSVSSSTGTSSSASTPSTGTSSTGTSSSTSVKDGTYTGTAETVRYGTTQVKVTIAAGKITEVTVVQENQDDQRSVQISENAFPTLRSEVLSKQTAAVDTVSGATYTSDQYEASLQSALDQAGYTAPDGTTASTDVSTIQESGGGFGH